MHRLLFLLPLLVLGTTCGDQPSPSRSEADAPEKSIPFRIDGTLDVLRQGEVLLTLNLEIAEGDSATMRGLMQRTAIPDRTGMLFLFDNVQIRSFWMGNTPLPLDLLFIGPDSQIVDFAKYTTPFSDDPIPSAVPAQYVLEVPAGFVDSYGIVEGDRVRWRRTDGP